MRRGRQTVRALGMFAALLLVGGSAALVLRQQRQEVLDRRMFAAIDHLEFDKALALLNEGASPHARELPEKEYSFLQRLIRLFRPTSNGRSALYRSVEALNAYTPDYYSEAVRRDRITFIEALATRGANVNTLCCDYPPLTVAAINHDVKVIRLLLQHGADPNQRDHYGRVPLLFAAGWGKPEEIRELVKYKADINLPDSEGHTALIYAIAMGQPDNVKELLRYHPQVNLRNPQGQTALFIATMSRKGAPVISFGSPHVRELGEICDLLKQAGGQL